MWIPNSLRLKNETGSAVAKLVESGRLAIAGLLVRVSPPVESLCYVLEQDT